MLKPRTIGQLFERSLTATACFSAWSAHGLASPTAKFCHAKRLPDCGQKPGVCMPQATQRTGMGTWPNDQLLDRDTRWALSQRFLGRSCRPVRVDASPSNPKPGRHMHGIVHLDGSARIQTVEQADAPWLHSVLTAVAKKSGLGILLNTSVNQRGKPIVNRSSEGLAMLSDGLDFLLVEDWLFHSAA